MKNLRWNPRNSPVKGIPTYLNLPKFKSMQIPPKTKEEAILSKLFWLAFTLILPKADKRVFQDKSV